MTLAAAAAIVTFSGILMLAAADIRHTRVRRNYNALKQSDHPDDEALAKLIEKHALDDLDGVSSRSRILRVTGYSLCVFGAALAAYAYFL